MLFNLHPTTGGGVQMEIIITFLVTVAAGVVCHLISKWLDRHDKDSRQPGGCFATTKRKEESLDCTPLRSGDSFFAYMDFSTFLCLTALQHMQILNARYISFSQNKNFILSIANLNSTPIWNLILQIFFLSTVEFNLSE